LADLAKSYTMTMAVPLALLALLCSAPAVRGLQNGFSKPQVGSLAVDHSHLPCMRDHGCVYNSLRHLLLLDPASSTNGCR
jgi:hypothetical protein